MIIQKPNLQLSVMEKDYRVRYQRPPSRKAPQTCTCGALRKAKSYGLQDPYGARNTSRLRWNVTTFLNSLTHHKDCVCFQKCQNSTEIGLRVAFSGFFLHGAIQAAMSMTRGSGGFSISPALLFNYVVSSRTGPFLLLSTPLYDKAFRRDGTSVDIRIALEVRKRKLVRLFHQNKASPSDVDEHGNTVMHVSFLEQQSYRHLKKLIGSSTLVHCLKRDCQQKDTHYWQMICTKSVFNFSTTFAKLAFL